MPGISVIVPVHNTVQYLERCVESILSQTFEDLEIILAENLSDDGSAELCDKLALRDNRIKVMHLDKAGPSYARNQALKICSSPYIGYVDSDDYIDKDMYETLYGAAVEYGADVVYCNFRMTYPDGRQTPSQGSGKIVKRKAEDIVTDIFTETVSSAPWTKIFRRHIPEKTPFPEGRLYEDHAVVYKIIADCSCCVWVDRTFYSYYQRPESTCHTPSPSKIYDYFCAESGRIDYLDRYSTIPQETKDEIFRIQVRNSIYYFRLFITLEGGERMQKEIKAMRSKLSSVYKKKDILPKLERKRLFKIKYFWRFYKDTFKKEM